MFLLGKGRRGTGEFGKDAGLPYLAPLGVSMGGDQVIGRNVLVAKELSQG